MSDNIQEYKHKGILKQDATVGRLLIIDMENPPELTAEEFTSYINEGFVPVLQKTSKNDSVTAVNYSFGGFQVDIFGVVTLLENDASTGIFFYPVGAAQRK